MFSNLLINISGTVKFYMLMKMFAHTIFGLFSAKVSDTVVTTALLNFFMVMFKAGRLLKVRETSWFQINTQKRPL